MAGIKTRQGDSRRVLETKNKFQTMLLVNDGDFLHHNVFCRSIARASAELRDLHHHVFSLGDSAKDGVAVVEVRSLSDSNKKLTAVCFRARIGHRKSEWFVSE